MKVLVITGDRRFTKGNSRYDLQESTVNALQVLYWGHGSLWPKVPHDHFDVVTVQDPFWRGLIGWYVARRLGAKFNVQVHTDLAVQSLVRHILAQIVLRYADSIRVVSERIKKQVAHMGVRAPMYVLPVYIDVNRFISVVRRPHTSKNMLWVGRFEAEKDPFLAIDVLKEVLQKNKEARLVMLGDGTLKDVLSHYAANLPVEFPGWKDPTLYLETADVVLSTSKHESYGASILEALAAHVPVVAPDIGIAKEAGAMVVPRSELARATLEVLASPRRGELKLPILTEEDWKRRWRESLEAIS